MTVECPAYVEGCADCDAEKAYAASRGHVCDTPGKRYMTFCELTGGQRRRSEEFHRALHEPQRCAKCKAFLFDRLGHDETVNRTCWARQCTHVCCPQCGHPFAEMGPIDCPACGSFYEKPVKLSRIRSRYRARRRYW